jgi:hypothetical protein
VTPSGTDAPEDVVTEDDRPAETERQLVPLGNDAGGVVEEIESSGLATGVGTAGNGAFLTGRLSGSADTLRLLKSHPGVVCVMSRDSDASSESRISTDPDTIRSWSERHTLVPVRRGHGGESHLDVVSEVDAGESDRLSWDEFRTELRREDHVVVYRGDRPEDIDVVDRSEAVGRAPIGDGVAEALLGGETVETEVTERRVVEDTVVEEATLESEIVDRGVIQSDLVDVELLTTDVDHATVTRTEAPAETAETIERFQPGTRTDESYDVEIAVEESWSLTREVVERIAIESRVVHTDVEDTETVESDTLRETVDVDGVVTTVVEGELVASPETAAEAVEQGRVRSQFREDDVIETHLIRRQTIDEEIRVRKEIRGEISDAEALGTEAVTHTVVESEITDADEYGVDLSAVDADRERATAEGTATTASTETPVTPTGHPGRRSGLSARSDDRPGAATTRVPGVQVVPARPADAPRERTGAGRADPSTPPAFGDADAE